MNKDAFYQMVFEEAQAAAKVAREACVPQPMVVGSPVNIMQEGGPFREDKPVYFVSGGVCGFAWVNFPDGRSGVARWFRNKKVGYKSYYGGYDVGDYHFFREDGPGIQSLAKNEASARAVASVYKKHGIEAFSRSRID